MGQSSYSPPPGGGGGDSLWQFVGGVLSPSPAVLATITEFIVKFDKWQIGVGVGGGIYGGVGYSDGNVVTEMVITAPNTIEIVTTDGTTYGNGLQVDETQFVLNTSDEAGGEYGIGSNLSDQSVIMNAVQIGAAMQHEVTLGGVDEAYNGSVVFGIESNGKIKTNQAQTVAPTALVAYTERIPIYDTTGAIIAYLPFQ
jgi:hypothetical protein